MSIPQQGHEYVIESDPDARWIKAMGKVDVDDLKTDEIDTDWMEHIDEGAA